MDLNLIRDIAKEIYFQLEERGSLVSTLGTLQDQGNRKYRNIYKVMHTDHKSGKLLHEILFDKNIINDPVWLTIISKAKKTRNYGLAVKAVFDLSAWNSLLNKRILNLLISNFMILSGFFFWLFLFVVYVFPTINDFYNSFEIPRGMIFNCISAISQFMADNWLACFLMIFVIIILCWSYLDFFLKNRNSLIRNLRVLKSINTLFKLYPGDASLMDIIATADSLKINLKKGSFISLEELKNNPSITKIPESKYNHRERSEETTAIYIDSLFKEYLSSFNKFTKKTALLSAVFLFFLISAVFSGLIIYFGLPLLRLFNIL